MSTSRCEGEAIILQVIKKEERSCVMRLFFQEFGVLDVWVRMGASTQFLQPLLRAYFSLERGRTGGFFLKDVQLVGTYPRLRGTHHRMVLACDMLNVVSEVLWREDPTPALYRLLHIYLEEMERSLFPETLLLSFRMKSLKSQGFYPAQLFCSICGASLAQEGWFIDGEWRCPLHREESGVLWHQEERELLDLLAHTTRIESLCLEVAPEEQRKVTELYQFFLRSM